MRTSLPFALVFSLSLSATGAASAAAPPPPPAPGSDLILLNGHVVTMDASGTVAEAVAISGDKITAVGSTADIKKMAGSATRTIDLQGKTLLPGFIDSRIHGPFGFWEAAAGAPLLESDGSPMSRPEVIEARVKQWMADHKPAAGVWVVGAGFNPKLAVTRGFDRSLADRIAPDNPLLLLSLDHHVAVVNGKAIELGLLKDLPPQEARLDPQGVPTGLVREGAVFLLMNRIWSLQPEGVRLEATQRFEETATRFGITTVGNPMIVPEDLTLAESLIADGKMPVRLVAGSLGANAAARTALDDYRRTKQGQQDRLEAGSSLYLIDGTLLGWGAAQFQVYKDASLTSGLLAMMPEEIDRLVHAASPTGGGDGVVLDATGNLAVHVLFDALEKEPGMRVRADSLEVMTPSDRQRLPRIAHTGLIASLQPTRFPFRLFLQSSIGEEQMTQAMPYKSLVDAGLPVAINSDWPMTAQTFKPTQLIEWAVTRAGWHPEEGLTVAQALAAYTRDAARALGLLDKIGTIEAGKKADLVVLDGDPLAMAGTPDRISDIGVRLTVSAGSIEFEDRDGARPATGAGAAGRLKK